MRHSLIAIATAALVSWPAHAEQKQILQAPAPAWAVVSDLLPVPENPMGLVFMRRQDVIVHLDARGQKQYLGYRVKVLHANALALGNISLEWNPAAGPPIVHSLKLYRDGQTQDILAKTSFEILRREDQLEAAHLDGLLTAVLRVPDLRVGDELEFAVTVPIDDPTLGPQAAGLLSLPETPPAGRYRLAIEWTGRSAPHLKISPDLTKSAQQRDGMIDFRFDDPPAVTPVKGAPVRYNWQRVVEFSDFSDWAAVSRYFAPLFAKASNIGTKSPLKQEVARIMAAHVDPLDRASAALKLVQQDIRYIYVGLNGGNLTPATADETWERRYGDCKAKTALLMGLLREMGIDAEPVLVNSQGLDDGLDARLPSPKLFDHILVRAHIGGVTYWLDGTLPPVAAPTTTPILPLKWVLPLSSTGNMIEHLDWHPDTQPNKMTLVEIDARPGFNVPAQVTYTEVARGLQGLQLQAAFSGLTADQIQTAMRQKLVGETWRSVDSVKWHYDVKARASIMAISGTWTLDWDKDNDTLSYGLPGGGFSPPDRLARSSDQDQTAPYYNAPGFSCNVTTIKLPFESKSTNWSTKPNYDTHILGANYYRAMEVRGGTIRMVRGYRVEQQEVTATDAKRDNDRVGSFDNSIAWITYDPTTVTKADKGLLMVPATYDVDWISDSNACLAPAKSK